MPNTFYRPPFTNQILTSSLNFSCCN